MPKRIATAARGSTFLRQWREHRGLNLDRMAKQVGQSVSTLSRVEKGLTPYSQDFIEAYARILDCHPADFLLRPPTSPESIWQVYDGMNEAQRADLARIARALRNDEAAG
jgi:transcriptional regulator with XRE-family HTH domain